MRTLPEIRIVYPDWVAAFVRWDREYPDLDERMRLAIGLSRENVLRGTGGPFGAVIFEAQSGRPVAVGVNLVIAFQNSTLHAEMVAFMMAERVRASHTLGAEGLPAHQLVTSCEPCAMCLGAALWSGVSGVVTGAAREDAQALKFDEGPVFAESYRYLEQRGITIVRGVLRDEARAVLALYRERGGAIYNG